MKKKFKTQLEIATFLQETLHSMPAAGKGYECEEAIKFTDFFKKVSS